MKALVTGVQGFIGRYVAALLLERGYDVFGIGRSTSVETFTHTVTWRTHQVSAPLPEMLRERFASHDYRYVSLDLSDAVAVAELFNRVEFDVVFHLAGALRDSPIEALARSNIVATQALLDAVSHNQRAPRIVFGSSGSVVGPVSESNLPVRADRRDAIHPVDPYAVTKRAAEDLAFLATQDRGLDIVIGRIFAVMGPGQEERHLCGHLARQFAERRVGVSKTDIDVGPLTVTRDFVDVRDVAAQLVLLGEVTDPPKLCNVASGRETPSVDVFNTLKSITGDPADYVPNKPGRTHELGRSFADLSHLSQLGFSPSFSLEQSLSDLLQWYENDVADAYGLARKNYGVA